MKVQGKEQSFSNTYLAVAIRITIFGFCAISVGLNAYAEQYNQVSTIQEYHIAPSTLGKALSNFALQSGVALSFDPLLLKGINSSGLNGQYRVDEGFQELLKNTKYQIKQTSSGYALEEKPQNNKRVESVKLTPLLSKANQDLHSSGASSDALLPTISLKAEDRRASLQQKSGISALGNKSILDTPFSIAVVTSEEIEKRGAKSLGQIFANDPSVYTPTTSMTTDWWGTQIRGLGVRNYYVDDIPLSLAWGGDFPVEAADQVIALKGLTGFMYGFGSPGGAISYQTKRPTSSPQTSLQVDYRNKNLFSAYLDKSDYLSSIDLGYRFTLGGDTGQAYNDTKNKRVVSSFALDKQFNDQLSWDANVIYEYNDRKQEPIQFYLDQYEIGNTNVKLPRVNYNYSNLNIDDSYYKTETLVSSSSLKWKLNEQWNTKYQFGYSRKKHFSNKIFATLDNSQGDYIGNLYNFAGLSQYFFNQIMMNGKFKTSWIDHDLVMGAGYIKNYDTYSDFFWGDFFQGNLYTKPDYQITHPKNFDLISKGSPETQKYAFMSDTLSFGPKWQAILGTRYTKYELESQDNTSNNYRANKATPTIALLYKPIPESTVYASYVEALEPGKRVEAPYQNIGTILNATISKQYELGFKYEIDKLSLTSALFRVERAELMDSFRNGLRYLTQDGLTNYQGLEFDSKYKLTDRLKVGLGFIHLDSEIKHVSEDNQSIKGNSPAFTAKWQGVINSEYSFERIEGLSIHGNIRYNGSSFITNNNLIKVPAYTIMNLGTSYKFKLNGYDATLNTNLNNVFNKKYWAGGGYNAGTIGEERNGSISIKVNW